VDLVRHATIQSEALREHIARVGKEYWVQRSRDEGQMDQGPTSPEMRTWRLRTLGELTENFDSLRVPVKGSDRRSGPYPYYGASGVVDHVDRYIFDGEYLLIAEDGENLRTRITPVAFLAKGRFWVNNHAHIVRGNTESDTRFLAYALAQSDISGYLTGSTMPKLTQGNLNRLRILAPPLDDQRAIAQILGTLDDKIELNRKMNETLEAMARAIFQSWFVDFDPVHAKARGQQPAGMSADIAALFPSEFEDSELGPIPRGWIASSLLDEIELIGGGTPKTNVPDYWDGDIPWFSVVDAPAETDIWVVDTEKHISESGVRNSSTRLLPNCTTIVSARGTVGKCALVGRPMAMNQSCYGVAPSDDRGGFYTYFRIRHQVNELQRRGHGSVFNTITRPTFHSIRIAVPASVLTRQFDMAVGGMLQRVLANVGQTRVLAALRDTLLPRLISGQLRIPDAERLVLDAIE